MLQYKVPVQRSTAHMHILAEVLLVYASAMGWEGVASDPVAAAQPAVD